MSKSIMKGKAMKMANNASDVFFVHQKFLTKDVSFEPPLLNEIVKAWFFTHTHINNLAETLPAIME